MTSNDPRNTADHVRWLRDWAIEKALPLWSSHGYDRKRGGFHEQLNPDGTPDLAAARRLRVQTRQIYVFAEAAQLQWFAPARQLMFDAFEFLLSKYRAPDGKPGYVFALAPDNTIANDLRSTYDHMFVLLAFARVAGVTGDAQVRLHLEDALDFVEEHLALPDASFVEGIPPALPRRQNPHMHAFEAMLSLHEFVRHPRALPKARQLLNMLRQVFLDKETGSLREFFDDQWRPLPGEAGDTVEPGHQAEWAWLVRRYERLSGVRCGALASDLLQAALRGKDPRTGFLVDETDRRGEIRRDSRRAWPQTELAKAWIAEAESGNMVAKNNALSALHAFARHYLSHPVAGAWIEQFDAAGHPLTHHIPATSLYHIFGAITEANRVFPITPEKP
jgi:mannose/cellobiose epimerase-like protein (N-acyl-D-glucosamine 2-epimerase family)